MSSQLAFFNQGAIHGELQFAEFYRERLRPTMGQRIKATDLRSAYLAWAEAKGRGSLSARELARHMERRGHHRLRSNGVRYLDVGFADGPNLHGIDPLIHDATALVLGALGQQEERARRHRARMVDLTHQVDGLIEQLQRLRCSIRADIDA